MTYINYNDPQSVLRQNQTPNAGCMIGSEFYDIRNLLHRIEALERENERLREALGHHRHETGKRQSQVDRLKEDIERITALYNEALK